MTYRRLQRFQHLIPPLISMVLLVVCVWILQQEVRHYSITEIWRNVVAIPLPQLGVSIGFTLINMLIFTGYDALSLTYIRHPLPYPKTALVAAISAPVSNVIGFALLSSSAIRYRFYTTWGLSALQIAQIIAFCNLSFWLGLFVVGGTLFFWQPIAVPALLHLPFTTTEPLGIGFLAIIAGYVMWNAISRRSLRIRSIVIPHLPLKLCFAQLLISTLDWTFAALVCYTLLPDAISLSFTSFFGIYLLAQFAGIVSNVPGGLGVFETVVLLLLAKEVSSATLLGVLLAHRVIYYLLPLMIALLLLGGYEIYQRFGAVPKND